MTTTSTTTNNQQTSENADNNILARFIDNPFIRNRIQKIKQDDDFRNEQDLTTSDQRRTSIMEMAEYLEGEMAPIMPAMVSEICVIIQRIFEKHGLDKYAYLIWEVLDDKYKNRNKDTYKKRQSKILANKIKRHLAEIEAIDMSLLEPDDLYDIKGISLSVPDNCDRQLLVRDQPTTNIQFNTNNSTGFNTLEDLKEIERNRFKKASVGEPLSTPEKLCAENPEYAQKWPDLIKELDQSVRGMMITRDWFMKYPPLTVDLLDKLTQGFRIWNEYWRPYYDKKYRRDHYQAVKTAYMRVLHTSTKASHESQIACAHHLDKNGLPVMRGLTKEQVDSMYFWEINFSQEFLNTVVRWPELISEVNKSHGQRNLEDRALDLSSTLSHHATVTILSLTGIASMIASQLTTTMLM